jgi:hypothetical protein
VFFHTKVWCPYGAFVIQITASPTIITDMSSEVPYRVGFV